MDHIDVLARALNAEVRETHISWVLLTERDVYKIKKPVDFGFLDFTTLELRRRAALAEVELNRRLSPDVYLGVLPVYDDPPRIGQGPGAPIDVAVHMRRLPDSGRLDVMLDTGRLGDEHLAQLADALARFHAAARADEETARHGTVEAIAYNVDENFQQTRQSRHDMLSDDEAYELEQWLQGFRATHGAVFDARIAAGRVRDCHGDLRLEQIYVDADGSLRILDCIEFNDRFRYADVASDIAFLSMDLTYHERPELAERLLALYARASQDYALYSVIDFYEGYRAYVRGKIESFNAGTARAADGRARAMARARRYYLLALSTGRPPLVRPTLVAVGGLIASGKSTFSDALSRALGVAVVDTDRTRKSLMGVGSTVALGDAAYSGDITRRVYDEVLRRADVVLESGRPVIVEASYRARADREAVKRLARKHAVPLLFVECHAPLDVLRARLAARERAESVSDARLENLEAFVSSYETPHELDTAELLRVDTTERSDVAVRAALVRLGLAASG